MLFLLAILIFIFNFAHTLFLVCGFELSAAAEFLYAAAFPCGAIWWLRSDVHGSPVRPLYCHGVLVGSCWLVTIPYHLVKTRGVKGLLPLALLASSWVFAQIAAAVVYFAVFGFTPRYY